MIANMDKTKKKKSTRRKMIIRWQVWILLVAIAAIILSIAECYNRTTSYTYQPVNVHYESSEGTD